MRNLYVVYDRVAGESGMVFALANDGVALRQFRTMFKDFDDDGFELWHIGFFDNDFIDKEGFPKVCVKSLDPPKRVLTALEVARSAVKVSEGFSRSGSCGVTVSDLGGDFV